MSDRFPQTEEAKKLPGTGILSDQTGLLGRPVEHELEGQSPGLPDGVWRDGALETVLSACGKQMSPAAREVLRFYARMTRPSDWSDPGIGPVSYVAQNRLVEELGLSRKTVYNAERRLETLGLIAKIAADNGRRYGPTGSGGEPCGIYFAPLIENYPTIAAKAAETAAHRDRLHAARRVASRMRFRLRALLRDAGQSPETEAARQALAKAPRHIMGRNS